MSCAARNARIAGVFAFALLLPGCAALAPDLTPPASGAATAAAAPAPAGAAASRPAAPGAATNDSLPSPEAQRVLATIPEPLAASERVAPPDSAIAPDTAAVRADTTHGGVPVPAPTEPLGQSSAAVDRMTSPDSAFATAVTGGAGNGGAAGAVGGAGAAASAGANRTPNASATSAASSSALPHSTPCFKLQVGAPADAKKADGLKRAASSQLELDFEIAHVKNLYKVRTHECFSREAADALKKRAVAAGFQGVFAVAATAP